MTDLGNRLEAVGLRIAEVSVMMLIDGRTDLKSSDVGRILDIQRANMVPLLNRLEKAGLIRRQPIDRKSQAIIVTPAGEARLAAARKIVDGFEADLLARIPPEHRSHFIPALNALWQ